MCKLLVFILLIFIPVTVYAESINITGNIQNKKSGLPVEAATISLFKEAKNIYTLKSDSTGKFSIPANYYRKATFIIFHSLNFTDLKVENLPDINQLAASNYSLGSFSMSQVSIQLKEIKVKATRRYRDTTKIDLSKQTFDRSVRIDNLFSQNGFYKDDKGVLYYKGKTVSDLVVNDKEFFGKNDTDIYKLIPALALENIEITETNIDSTTNTTALKPTVKVNLKLKDKYNHGRFGNLNVAGGTSSRYLIGANAYQYSNKAQVSFLINSNNINMSENNPIEPTVSFSTNSNNITAHTAAFTYKNYFSKKLEFDFSVNGRMENKAYQNETDREDKDLNQYSKTKTASNYKAYYLKNSNLGLIYKIDPLNTILFYQTFNYNQVHETDTSNYSISSGNYNSYSNLLKKQNISGDALSSKLVYQKRFASKKGRYLKIEIDNDYNSYRIHENDSIAGLSNSIITDSLVSFKRNATKNVSQLNIDFTEPTGDNGFISGFNYYKKDIINYNSNLTIYSAANNIFTTNTIVNNYLETGIKIHQTFTSFSLDGTFASLYNWRSTQPDNANNFRSVYNIIGDAKLDYKITKQKNFTAIFKADTQNPTISQLTNLSNTVDLVSQMDGNIKLKPEQKKSLYIEFSNRKSDSLTVTIKGGFDYYSQKFGLNIYSGTGAIQNNFWDNLGHAITSQAGFSIFKKISDKFYLNYNNTFIYQQSPNIINHIYYKNSSINFNQSISIPLTIIKSLFTISPIISGSVGRYNYQTTSSDIVNILYSDKLAFTFFKFHLNFYPYANYSHSISNNTTFSTNGELKRGLFHDTGFIWIQAYDLFNSFKYFNNYAGANYVQSTVYSNLHRYILLGISLQFNNIK